MAYPIDPIEIRDYERVMLEILRQTISDIKSADPKVRAEAVKWMESLEKDHVFSFRFMEVYYAEKGYDIASVLTAFSSSKEDEMVA